MKCDPPLLQGEVETIARSASKYEKGESIAASIAGARYSNTDTGNAQHFRDMYADKLRYDHTRRQWFMFNGHYWRPDRKGEVDQMALESVHERQRKAIGNEADAKWAANSLSSARRSALLNCAQSEPPLSITGDEWDRNPMLLGVPNGVINLRTGERRKGNQEDFITKTSPVAFDKDAPRDKWMNFLATVFADNPEMPPYMKRVVGYTLTGDTSERCFWVLHGIGANGKTTLLEALTLM